MAAKTYKTSKEPSQKMKGGLDAIEAGSIYAIPKKGKREKVRKQSIQSRGGMAVVKNDWKVRQFKVEQKDGTKHEGKLFGATVVREKPPEQLVAVVSGEKVILGMEHTYTDEMIAIRDEPVMKNPNAKYHNHKVRSNTTGYMENLRKNGRRVMRHNCNLVN